MTIPTLTPLPPAPSRLETEETFVPKADALLAALPTMVTEENAAFTWMDAQLTATESARDTAIVAKDAALVAQTASEAAQTGAELAESNTEQLLLSRGDLRNTGEYQAGFNYLVSDVFFYTDTGITTWYLVNTAFTSTDIITDLGSGKVQVWQGLTKSNGVAKIASVFDPAFANLVEGQAVELIGYHPDTTVGGGSGVVKSARHNGGTAISLARERPTNWNDQAQLTAWFADSGSAELCFVRTHNNVDIIDFGGVDDDDGSLSTTNNVLSFSAYFKYLNSIGGGQLNIPKTKTGGYLINGDDTTSVTSDIEIVADDGVYLRIIYSGGINNSPFSNNSLRYNRELLKIQQNFGFNIYGADKAGIKPSASLPTITQTQGVYSEPRLLTGSNFVVVDLADPDNTVAPISNSSDSILFDGTSKTVAAIKAARIGEETFALISNPAGGHFFAGVKTVQGYAYYYQNSGTQEVALREAANGLNSVVLGVPYSLLNQQRDLFNNALMSVRIISARQFSVLANGLVVGTYKTRSNITGVMFGTEGISGTTAVSQFSSVRTNSTGGSKPLKLVCLGDSISDNDVQYSNFRVMSSILQSQGQQLAELRNLAVSGETAGQQYARLQAVGSGYDYCLVQVGVNDIQGTTDFTAFTQTILDICNYAKSMGMTPIVGVPTAFYSRDEANAHGQTGGQNTANNVSAHTYKALLIRAVASAGALLNLQSIKNYGAITASWLDMTMEGVKYDSVVTDNIHPTPYGSMMIGLGWAESILGALHRLDDTDSTLFESVPVSWMRNGFGTVSRPVYKGFRLSGIVDFGGGSNAEGNPFMQLPKHLHPTETKLAVVTCLNSGGLPAGTANLYIGHDGNCYGFNLPATTTSISLNDVDLSETVFV